jgi:hypothetical protein
MVNQRVEDDTFNVPTQRKNHTSQVQGLFIPGVESIWQRIEQQMKRINGLLAVENASVSSVVICCQTK